MHANATRRFQGSYPPVRNADVLGEIGVINAARLQVEHLGRKQPGRVRRVPVLLIIISSKFFSLYVIEHFGESAGSSIFASSYSGNSNSPMGGKFLIGMLSMLQFVSRNDDD